jgi:PEP-CTERM motif
MKKLQTTILTLSTFCLAAMSASAQVTINVEGTMAPNAYGSPSWNSWVGNAFYAAENGLTSYGAAGPTQFSVTTTPLPVSYNMVTGFNSWEGQADPAAPYNNEYGTRGSFVAIINGNGTQISMDGFGANLASTPVNSLGALGFDAPNNSISPNDWNYDSLDIGIIFNNGLNISGGFSIVNSGPSSQLVNEIISVGAGDAYASYLGDDASNPSATDQQTLDYDIAQVPNGYNFTGTFYYDAASSSATLNFSPVPEPTTLALAGLGLGTLFIYRRKK